MKEEEDEVVTEVDVYLSKALAKNLFLFQYPVRPSTKSYDDAKCFEARIKPMLQKVELELGINVRSPNYDRSKGEQIALNVDGQNSTENTYFNSCYMDKQLLTSTKAVTSSSRYAIGLLRSGELHLTPLSALVQLRPSFSYLDKSDSRTPKSEQTSEMTDEGMQEEEEAQAVHVKFAGIETERGKLARERSYNYLQQRLASEPWKPAVYHPFGSRLSSMEGAYLYCSKMDHDASDLPGTIDEYIKSLLPDSLRVASGIEFSGSQSCMMKLQNLPLAEQIKSILMNAKVIKFSQLMELLPAKTDFGLVLRSLQQLAMLVQGCWVIKSEILYPKESTETSVGSEALCRARDYIMWKFTENVTLRRSEVMNVVKLPVDEVTELLNQFGKREPSVGWSFVYSIDKEFLSKYPEVVHRQKMLWDARYLQIIRVLQQKNTKESASRTPKSRQRQRSHRESVSDSAEDSNVDEMMDATPLKKSQSAKTDSSIRRTTKNGPRNHIATLDISPTEMDFSPSPEMKRELVQFINEELKPQFCFTLAEAKRLLMLKLAKSPPGHLLSRGVSDVLIQETFLDLGAQQLQNKWPQNTTPEPLFAFLRLGDYQDKFREALIDLFTKTARLRISTFQKKVEDELGESMTETVCRKLLQDYCITKSGFYYLKGTITNES